MNSGRTLLTLAIVAVLAACSSTDDSAEMPSTTFPPELRSERCEVRVHGRSERGAAPFTAGDHVVVQPDANEPFEGGGRVWIYDSEETFADGRERLASVIDDAGCEVVALHGFSNGAAFAARLVCTGETFGGRLVGAVIDDPVSDDSSPDCQPDESVEVALYWTGSIPDEGSCSELRWTCAGGDELIGIERFADRLGATVQQSPETEHVVHPDPPEIQRWLQQTS